MQGTEAPFALVALDSSETMNVRLCELFCNHTQNSVCQ